MEGEERRRRRKQREGPGMRSRNKRGNNAYWGEMERKGSEPKQWGREDNVSEKAWMGHAEKDGGQR